MYVAYQGSSVFLAIVNVVLGSSDQATPGGLLRGYSFWLLLGVSAVGFLSFAVSYFFESFNRLPRNLASSNEDIEDKYKKHKEEAMEILLQMSS